MIYAINLAPYVAVCLHCGELAPDGALFCAKCGYTLPQVDTAPPAPSHALPGTATPSVPPTSPPTSPPTVAPRPPAYSPMASPTVYAAPALTIPGGVGPIAPPPSAKYCVRCRTIIARAAVYCPVCQQPQP